MEWRLSRRALFQTGVVAAASAGLGRLEQDAAAASSDPWRGLKVGVASYTFRKFPLDATIRFIQRVDLHYVSVKEFHLPLQSSAQERKAVAQKFKEAGITPLSAGNIAIKNDEAQARNVFEYARDFGISTV